MVQGWESRAELANKRRAEARERKQARKAPKSVAGDAVINFLISAKYVDPTTCSIQAWVVNELGGKEFCSAHFRAEACKIKRCKFNHAFTIAGMEGVDYAESLNSEETEPYMDRYDDIALIPPKEQSNLKFLFVDGVCVYDRSNHTKWQQWSSRIKKTRSSVVELDTPQKPSALSTIREINEPQEDEGDIVSGSVMKTLSDNLRAADLDIEAGPGKGSPQPSPIYTLIPCGAMEYICSFVTDMDICRLYMTSMHIKDFVMNSEVSQRHRSYLNSVCPSGRELSKMKKQEKKKKLKAANSKVANKKDGHKKVKVCRR